MRSRPSSERFKESASNAAGGLSAFYQNSGWQLVTTLLPTPPFPCKTKWTAADPPALAPFAVVSSFVIRIFLLTFKST